MPITGLSLTSYRIFLLSASKSSRLLIGRQSQRIISTTPASCIVAKQAIERLNNPDQKVYDGGHSYKQHWKIERVLATAMLPLIPIGVLVPGVPVIDYSLATALVLHGYWGLMGVTQDYLSFRGLTRYKGVRAGITVLCGLGLAGLFYFNYTDIGITNALRSLWTL